MDGSNAMPEIERRRMLLGNVFRVSWKGIALVGVNVCEAIWFLGHRGLEVQLALGRTHGGKLYYSH